MTELVGLNVRHPHVNLHNQAVLVRNSLIQLLKSAVKILVEKNGFSTDVEDLVEVEPPKQADHGDFAINFCLVASKKVGQNPRALAEMLVEAIREADATQLITEIEIAGPGFINFRLSPTQVAEHIGTVLAECEKFGNLVNESPDRINVEFVSVNPNGPITIGSGRGAAFGSALCNVLEAAGNVIHREYYINDGVNSEQMRLFAESVKAIIEGREVPENGYKGDYVHDVAHKVKSLLASDPSTLETELLNKTGFWKILEIQGVQLSFPTNNQLVLKKLHRIATRLKENPNEPLSIPELQLLCETLMIQHQGANLTTFQVNFDTWFSEQSLHDSGEVENTLQHLLAAKVADDKPYRTKVVMAKGGVIKEVLKEEQPTDEEEADLVEVPPPTMGGGRGGVEPVERTQEANKTIWLRSTKFGDDQDRVLKRKDGRLTYIASDVAYHKDKFNRPADGNKLITVLGPDHHGYIARLTAVVAAMFSDQVEPLDNPEPLSEHEALIYDSVADRNQCQAALAWAKEHLQVQIFQIVRFLKDGKPAPMRKRDGNIYALIDLVNEIGSVLRPNGTESEKQQAGSDVARFFYLMRHHDTAMDFDLELATKQSDENPVFYVQYAHARISSVLEKAKESGFELPPLRANGEGDRGGEVLRMSSINPGLLNHAKEIALILKICDLPHEVERTAHDYSVNRLTTYAIELARTYHSFYDSCRVIQSDQPELTLARLALCQATRIALKNALNLLGVSAPERMDRTVSN